MSRNKLQKFADILHFQNVLENCNIDNRDNCIVCRREGVFTKISGKWGNQIFCNRGPIILELACGKGEYSNELSKLFPSKNFIGIDIKGSRIWHGAKHALDEERFNVAFLRTRIEFITNFFSPNEVTEIWIIFPDPFIKNPSKRLTSPSFLNLYNSIIKKNGLFHLKTDDLTLYQYTLNQIEICPYLELLSENRNIYSSDTLTEELSIKTYYEKIHLKNNKTIKYICARFI